MENKLGYRLLIVEDDCLMAEGTADYFTGKGWNVKIAEEGQTALELLEQEHFHLILLDVKKKKKNGFTLCRKIRENSDVPIIFITARVLEEDKLNGYALGGDDYVTKPFSLPVLYAKAMALLNRIRGNGTLLKAGRLTVDQTGIRSGIRIGFWSCRPRNMQCFCSSWKIREEFTTGISF